MTITCSPGGRCVLNDGLDLSVVEAEADMVAAVLLHDDGALEGTLANGQRDPL